MLMFFTQIEPAALSGYLRIQHLIPYRRKNQMIAAPLFTNEAREGCSVERVIFFKNRQIVNPIIFPVVQRHRLRSFWLIRKKKQLVGKK